MGDWIPGFAGVGGEGGFETRPYGLAMWQEEGTLDSGFRRNDGVWGDGEEEGIRSTL